MGYKLNGDDIAGFSRDSKDILFDKTGTSYSSDDVDGVLREVDTKLSENTKGNNVSILNYTSSSPYVCTTDGYLQVATAGSGSFCKCVIADSNGTSIASVSASPVPNSNLWNSQVVYIRRGLKLFMDSNTTGSNKLATFIPLT